MERRLMKELGYGTVTTHGSSGGGSISTGQGYLTDHGAIFVKINPKSGARTMFDGESASLEAIMKTNTVKVPKPIKVFDEDGGGAALVMEYFDLRSLRKYSALLGEQLASLHLNNTKQGILLCQHDSSIHKPEGVQYVSQFGFSIPTCCGYIPQDNTWQPDWLTFFTRQKLQQQLDMVDKKYHDNEARTLWSEAQLKLHKLFAGLDIKPSLLHGDLWGGNAAETDDGPVIFDAASFYGHHEYDLGISQMFGGFSTDFFKAYHRLIPKSPGFDKRNELYQLFHYLNHWNHFGSGYRSQSISILKQLARL